MEEKRKKAKERSGDSERSGENPSDGPTSATTPGGRSTRNPKQALKKPTPEDGDTPGASKKSITRNDGENSDGRTTTNADGRAWVGGVEGVFTCDGGCDRATATEAYAKKIIAAGAKFEKYEKPQLAELADGQVKPIISGYLLADIELETPAGKVVLPSWHVDVLQGPNMDNLLYMGQREETELQLQRPANGVGSKA